MQIKAPLRMLRLTEIRPKGWIAEQMRRDLQGYAGHLHELSREARADIFVGSRISGDAIRAWWDGETVGNWLDGLTRMAYLMRDEKTMAFVEQYLRRVIEHAKKDGYIGIYREDWRFRNDGQNGEPWTYSRILLALLAYYEATGSGEALEAIKTSVDLFIRNYTVEEGGKTYFEIGDVEHDLGKSHGLMVIEPLLFVYDLTGDERIVRFVRRFYEDFSNSKVTPWGYDAQLHRLLDMDQPFIGHGAHTVEHLRIPLLLYYYTGEEIYKQAYENAYRKLLDYVSVSGACKSDEMVGVNDIGCPPLPGVGYEYCAVTEQLLSLHFAAMLTGKGDYADQGDWLIMNAAQAMKSHDGMGVAYLSADNQAEASKKVGTRWDYSPTHDDEAVCCVPNAVRIMPYHVSRMWMGTADDGLALMFYGPNEVDTEVRGVRVNIEQQTAYPFEETVRLVVRCGKPVEFPLKLRVPGWARHMYVQVQAGQSAAGSDDVVAGSGEAAIVSGTSAGGGNGMIAGVREGDFYVLRSVWGAETVIDVHFSAAVETRLAADHTIAIARGPLLFALDIPGKKEPTRDYGVGSFADVDVLPADDKAWQYTLQIRENEENLGCTVERDSDFSYGWDDAPIRIKTTALNRYAHPEEITLVPIGCTLLRRTCFPYVKS